MASPYKVLALDLNKIDGVLYIRQVRWQYCTIVLVKLHGIKGGIRWDRLERVVFLVLHSTN